MLDVAIRKFSDHGIFATSLTDIAAAAGVTYCENYWHLKHKIDLFNEF
ncbi:MAG: TetR family transcriptional regulator [Serratia symbiotica]|nr:TetR family transcriptional regulator [Serratia symbiotica]